MLIDDLVSHHILFNYLDSIPQSYFYGIPSNIQNQINSLQTKSTELT